MVPDKNDNNANDEDIKVLIRVSRENNEYIKVIILNSRVVGCLLVGESDLEETFENLILSKIDVETLPFNLLDANVDLEDYFD